MHIAEIKATDKIEECWDLLQQHREELTTNKDLMVLKPDLNTYKVLEDKNMLFTLALYDEDKIVGYSVNILNTNLHYSDLLIAQNDVLFIHKEYRNTKWGVKLIAETESMALGKQAKLMLWHGKPNTSFSELMPKLGYGVQDIMFSKVL